MASYKSEILIDDESVWSTEDSVDKQTVQLDVSRFTGRKTLKFKMTKTSGDGPSPPPPDYDLDPEESWWTFSGALDCLRLPGIDAAGFDPSLGTNHCTVAGVIDTDNTINQRGIFAKWNGPANKRTWLLMTNPVAQLYFSTYGNGFRTDLVRWPFVPGTKSFVGGTYEFIGGFNSSMWIFLGIDSAWTGLAGGPLLSSVDADVQIADYDSGAGHRYFDGKIYWLAYWPRTLTHVEMLGLANKTILPYNTYPSEIKYIDFSRDVAATYKLNIGNEVFNVEGAPVKNGP